MKHVQIFGLAAMAMAALMALAGTASATQVTSPSGTVYTSTIKAESEGTTDLTGEFGTIGTIGCTESRLETKVESHGTSVTATGRVSSLTFETCMGGLATSPVANPGSLEVHTEGSIGNGNGTVTSSGAVFVFHETAVGTCTFETSNTDIGTLTGSNHTGGNATLDIRGTLTRVSGTNPFCGSTSTWNGSYKVTTPSTLEVD